MTGFIRKSALLTIAGAFLAGAFIFTPMPAAADEADDVMSIVNGGRLYDNWLKMTGAADPGKNHKSWKPAPNNKQTGDTTWRCKSCHGWDYKGKDGQQKGTEDATETGGITKSAGADSAKIIAVLKDATHDFGSVMKDDAMNDLANFVSKGQVDMDALLAKGGDAAKGKGYFETICVGCHKLDGSYPKDMAMKLGAKVNIAPQRALHNLINGNPIGKMPSLRALDMQVALDLMAHLKTLPK